MGIGSGCTGYDVRNYCVDDRVSRRLLRLREVHSFYFLPSRFDTCFFTSYGLAWGASIGSVTMLHLKVRPVYIFELRCPLGIRTQVLTSATSGLYTTELSRYEGEGGPDIKLLGHFLKTSKGLSVRDFPHVPALLIERVTLYELPSFVYS